MAFAAVDTNIYSNDGVALAAFEVNPCARTVLVAFETYSFGGTALAAFEVFTPIVKMALQTGQRQDCFSEVPAALI